MEKDSPNMEQFMKDNQEYIDKIQKETSENYDDIEEVVEKLYNHEKNEITVIDPKNKDWVVQLNNTIELLTTAVDKIYVVSSNERHTNFLELLPLKRKQEIMQYRIAELEKRLEYLTKKGGSNKFYKNIKTIKYKNNKK